MIISSLHRFIFVAIPKTGTHSVRQALRRHMGPSDLEQVGLFVQSKLPIPELARLQHGHLSLAQVYAALSYYHANRAEIDADLAAVEREADPSRSPATPTKCSWA